MKKFFVFLLVLACVFLMLGCGSDKKSADESIAEDERAAIEEISNKQYDVPGIIRKIEDDHIILYYAYLGNSSSSDIVEVRYGEEHKEKIAEFKVGDAVTVYYKGYILERYPPIIHLDDIKHGFDYDLGE